MGRLLVAAAGAIIGSFFGAPQLGFLAGNLLGSVLFPEKGPDGPRLENLDVTSSAFGQMIPHGYGTCRVNGNIIHGDRLKEVKHEGGKGMGGAQGTTYEYFWTGIASFGRGPADDVLRIWADTKVVFDKRPDRGQKTKKNSFKFRVLLGTETQLPDRYVIKDMGATDAIAYRGQVCIVFDNIPVADYGNRVPSWNAEVAWQSAGATSATGATLISGAVSGIASDGFSVDWTRGRFFVYGNSPNGLRRFDLNTMKETGQSTLVSSDVSSGMVVDEAGYIYRTGTGGNTSPIHKTDPDGFVDVSTFGISNSDLKNYIDHFVSVEHYAVIKPIGAFGIEDHLLTGSFFNDIGLLRCTRTQTSLEMDYVWGSQNFSGVVTGKKVSSDRVRLCAGPPKESSAFGYFLGRPQFGPAEATPLVIDKLEVLTQAHVGTNQTTGENLTRVFFTNSGSIVPSDVDPDWDEWQDADGLVADHTDDTMIFGVTGRQGGGPSERYLVKYDPHGAVIKWKIPLPVGIPANNTGFASSRIADGRYAFIVSGTIHIVDTMAGTMTTETVPSGVIVSGFQSYDGQRDAIVFRTGTGGISLLLLGKRSAAGEALANVVTTICGECGLEPSDIDVSELTDTVRGFLVNQQTTGRGAIEPLAFAFLFDGVESDDVVKFRKRGKATSLVIPQDKMVILDEKTGEFLKETRGQEMELPYAVSINYLNKDTDYQEGVARQKRIAKPVPSSYSRNESTTTIPLVMVPNEAKRLADIVLYQAWVERITLETRLSWEHILLDPVDSIDLSLDDGTVFHCRITNNDVGVNMTIDLGGATEKATAYTSTVDADGGQFIQPAPPASNETRSFVVDSTLLRDQDDTNGAVSLVHYAAGGYGQDGWPGMVLYKSADGVAYAQVGSSFDEVAWGVAVNTLPAPADPFITDEINTLKVAMSAGGDQLVSVTQLQMLNGANRAWLLKQDGEVEVVGFRDVVLNADGTYTLSGLLRGQRGTDTMMAGHLPGDAFVLLTPATVGATAITTSEIGQVRRYKPVPIGELLADTPIKALTSTGRDLKPYAPWSQKATLNAGDIDLTWKRRTRLGGGLSDGPGEPALNEASEAYEVDIWNAGGTAVLRTLVSSTPSVTYTAANIATDFGTTPTVLTVSVYQKSAVVGRGFAHKKTIPVE